MNERKMSFQKGKRLSYLSLSYLNTSIVAGAEKSIDQLLRLRFSVLRIIRFILYSIFLWTTKVIQVENALARAFIATYPKPVSNKKYP